MKYVNLFDRASRKEAQQEMFLRLACVRFGEVPEWVIQKATEADEDQLMDWSELLLSKKSLDEIMVTP